MAAKPEQKPLEGNEITTPALAEIRGLFEKKIPTNPDIQFWLQVPKVGEEKSDSGCYKRAVGLEATLKPDGANSTGPKDFTKKFPTPLADQWIGVDKLLEAKRPVIITALDTFIGGEKSAFRGGTSQHVMLFLAKGTEAGREFYVGYDPDFSATDATQAAWQNARSGNAESIISTMVFGTEGKVLGPLFRKYYIIDKTVFFPTIPRGV